VIYANTLDETFNLLRAVLIRCRDSGLYLKLAKSDFLKDEVKLLGHIISARGILSDPAKVEAIVAAKAPKCLSELRSFLGLASYLRRFVPHFATVAAPLADLTSPKRVYAWGEEQEEAFRTLKALLCERVLLTPPADHGQFALMTDASDLGVGAVLLQSVKGDDLRILEFASRKFTPVERRWDTREREAYAIRWAVEKFHDYIQMGGCLVCTDHESLQWMNHSEKSKVQRWSLYLQPYLLRVMPIPGTSNSAADWLSRSFEDVNEDELINSMSVPSALPAQSTPAVKTTARVFAPVVPTTTEFKAALLHDGPADWTDTVDAADGMRYHYKKGLLYVPRLLRESVLWWFHASKYGGHSGVNRMARRMGKWVWWPGLSQDIKAYVAACIVCVRKAVPLKRQTLQGVLTRPLPCQLVSLDYVGPRVICAVEWHYLILIDHASRFVVADATRTPTAEHAKMVLDTRWGEIFMAPRAVLTDRGSVFRSAVFNDYVTQELGAYHVFTSPYYPQGNGINEACHKAIEFTLTCLLRDSLDVAGALRDAVRVHNATPHPGTGMSPFYFLFGQEPVFPGWQAMSPSVNTAEARFSRDQERLRRALVDKMAHEKRQHMKRDNIVAGDWVVFPLGPYEKGMAPHPLSASKAMCPEMSLPAKVLEVKSESLMVSVLGSPLSRRDVSKSVCRVLACDVPPTLQRLALDVMQYEAPRILLACGVRRNLEVSGRRTWSQLAEDAGVAAKAVQETSRGGGEIKGSAHSPAKRISTPGAGGENGA
jgi:transposase InsO family protein